MAYVPLILGKTKQLMQVWTSTATDNGWIHAELAKDQASKRTLKRFRV